MSIDRCESCATTERPLLVEQPGAAWCVPCWDQFLATHQGRTPSEVDSAARCLEWLCLACVAIGIAALACWIGGAL